MFDHTEWKLDFCVAESGCLAHFVTEDERDALTIVHEDGLLTSRFFYRHTETPLSVSCQAEKGSKISIVFRPYRIELYADGVLSDEEWPFGEPLFPSAVPKVLCFPWNESPAPAPEDEPTITGSFTGAEGWCPGNGVSVGDCMPYADGERYHVLYLKDRHHHAAKWGKGAHQWSHLSTADLIHWEIHPLAVGIDDPGEGSICTGSWIKDGGKHFLYYSIRSVDGSPAPLRRSVSEDGYHFRKDPDFHFVLSERYRGDRARDPKVIRGEDGLLHMFVTTTDKTVGKGCLVHLISEDGERFREIGNIYTSPDESEPECSDYFERNGVYYLIISHRGIGEYLLSDAPFSGFEKPTDNRIPCSSVPKCAIWNGRILFAGFRGEQYAGVLTFKEAFQNADGTLSFGPVPECEK